jgi:DNA-binding CsgD family transcriptional regulator
LALFRNPPKHSSRRETRLINVDQSIDAARAACGSNRWGDAWRLFSAFAVDDLAIEDLDLFATAAYLTGHDEEGFGLWSRAHQSCAAEGTAHRAALYGTKVAQGLGFKGDWSRSAGWVERTAHLLEAAEIDCVEQGYLEHAQAMVRLFEHGDATGAVAHFGRAEKVGARFGSRELVTLARIGQARMGIYTGEIGRGITMLDESFVSIEAGELSAFATGDAYCTIIDACSELVDVTRCRTWTESFSRWCDAQQELVLYRGHCFIHRAEVLGLLGDLPAALVEARSACDRLAKPVMPAALGAACALEGDLQRLAGAYDAAETAYQRANELGTQPQPGLALLRLAEGRGASAATMIRRVLGETENPIARARLLGPAAEIALAAGDALAAREAALELRALAGEIGTPMLRAKAAAALGAVQLIEDDAAAALVELRGAFTTFNELGASYDAARVRLLIADACTALGDDDTAAMELKAATAALATLRADDDAPAPDGLTPREIEVLRLLARGNTNRVIAGELFISEKTVASHVAHIFTKLAVTTRAAATSYAYERGLV